MNTSSFCYTDIGVSLLSIASEGRKKNFIFLFFLKEENYTTALRRKRTDKARIGYLLGTVRAVHSRRWREAMKAMLGRGRSIQKEGI